METDRVDIRCSVDAATRDALAAMAAKAGASNRFAEFVGELIAKSVSKKN